MVRMSVLDTGRGIPPEAMPHLFEKFYRVPDSEGYVSGTGLGLPIAKRLVEALGGEMAVVSTFGAGTQLSFTLPLVPRKTGPLAG
jgi:signal transduction histidine kinase